MTTETRTSGFWLPMLLLGLLVLLVTLVAVAALVPLLPCQESAGEEGLIEPCVHCNGLGRSTLFQRWNYLQFQRQKDLSFRQWQM